jgi:ABC-type multidrug transport system fused ATPase/permease subunit
MQTVVSKKQARLELLERHSERLERCIARLTSRHRGMLPRQILVLFGGIFLSITALSIFPLLGLVCILGTAGLFIYNGRIVSSLSQKIDRYKGLLRIKQTHIARMRLDWENIPPVEDECKIDHPFENDLQISGPRSLHQLINTCYSDEGRSRLHSWLLNCVPDLAAIHARQNVVHELISQTRFRDLLQLHSRRVILDVNEQWDADAVFMWLDMPQQNKPPLFGLIISYVLSAVLLALFGQLLLYGRMPILYLAAAYGVSLFWSIPMAKYRMRLFADTSLMHEIFKQLDSVFSFLEKYPYGNHAHLKELCAPFHTTDTKPSWLLKRLKRIAQAAQLTQNQVVRQGLSPAMPEIGLSIPFLFNAIIPWDLTLSYLLVQCKDQAKEHLSDWLEAWYELEALCSLANFAYLNPDYVMPEIVKDREQTLAFSATQLGHPLIPDHKRIVNDVTMERVGDLLLITGSNMAGKSTFLRTLGINLCLAYAGSVVNAASLHTGLYEVYCCISVSDSLTDGYSYFHAEVRRLKLILDRLHEEAAHPVFVLIDEIFRGTNNRERSIGSHAYIYALAETSCMGAISTHDLELVNIVDELPQLKNYHFRDAVINDEMVFDYRLYPGPCPTTNALEIMQKEGLPITWKKSQSVTTGD